MLIRCTKIKSTHLEFEGLCGPRVGDVDVVGDEDVVEVDVAGHGPQLDAHRADRRHPREGVRVVVVVGVGDARRLPLALVCRVGDQRRVPLPLVPEKLANKACNSDWSVATFSGTDQMQFIQQHHQVINSNRDGGGLGFWLIQSGPKSC